MLLAWLASAVWQSAAIFYVSAWAVSPATDRSGILLGMWASGTLAYTLVVTTVRSGTPFLV